MPDVTTARLDEDDDLVDGRECGKCTVCCTVLKIDEPSFQKLSGITCAHCIRDGGCSIYQSRPPICRAWFCGWRRLPWLSSDMWPHDSGIMVRLRAAAEATAEARPGLTFHVLTSHLALYKTPVCNAIGTSIINGIPTYLGISAPVGYEGRLVRLNEALQDAVAKSDWAEMKKELRRAYFSGRVAPKAKSVFSQGNPVS